MAMVEGKLIIIIMFTVNNPIINSIHIIKCCIYIRDRILVCENLFQRLDIFYSIEVRVHCSCEASNMSRIIWLKVKGKRQTISSFFSRIMQKKFPLLEKLGWVAKTACVDCFIYLFVKNMCRK